jgi:hypothetical protein
MSVSSKEIEAFVKELSETKLQAQLILLANSTKHLNDTITPILLQEFQKTEENTL